MKKPTLKIWSEDEQQRGGVYKTVKISITPTKRRKEAISSTLTTKTISSAN